MSSTDTTATDTPSEAAVRPEGDEPEPEPTDDAQQAPEAAETSDAADQEPTGKLAKVRAEAQGLRGRLRDTEAERDSLAERVAALQRAEVVRLAAGAGRLADGEDLFRGEVDQAGLLGDDGAVDPELVAAAVAGVLAARPHWAHRPGPRPDPSQGARSEAPAGATWADVIGGSKR